MSELAVFISKRGCLTGAERVAKRMQADVDTIVIKDHKVRGELRGYTAQLTGPYGPFTITEEVLENARQAG